MNPDDIRIENLTQYQVEMLDIMWAIESTEEFNEWYNLLDDEDQAQADLLVRMIVIESADKLMDQVFDSVPDPYAEANAVLAKFRLQ